MKRQTTASSSLLVALVTMMTIGCATVSREPADFVSPQPVTPPPAASEAPVTAQAAAETLASADQLPPPKVGEMVDELDDEEVTGELTPEVFEEGFCVDDIYAKYLTAKYAQDHRGSRAKPHKVFTGGKSRRSRRGRHARSGGGSDRALNNFAALAYAHQVMAGRESPYFGAMPVVINDRVDFWVQYFKTSGRKMFMRWLVRGESIKRMVQPILQENGVPLEFFYLAMIESGLSNNAYSSARATGTWQFMSGTAQLYGLKINHWVDERKDPIKSTIAAANYLKDLYADLGDWHLAMAAYNAGPGKVRKALKRNARADFWGLCETPDLAHETKDYVPKVLAAVMLAQDPRAHGFDVQSDGESDLPSTEVLVKRPVKLDELAGLLGIPLSTLARWNPELIRNITPPSKHGYPLRLSPYYAGLFPGIESKLSLLSVTDVQMHKVRKGDTLSRIAKRYHVGVKQILSLNPELSTGKLKPGRTIAIPIPGVFTTGGEGASAQGKKIL